MSYFGPTGVGYTSGQSGWGSPATPVPLTAAPQGSKKKDGYAPSFTPKAIPELKYEGVDPGAVAAQTQALAAPGLQKLRTQLGRLSAQSFANPAQRAQAWREALAGFGQGVGTVMAGAGTQAYGQVAQEAAQKAQIAAANWRAQMEAQKLQEARDWYEYQERQAEEEQQQLAGTTAGGGGSPVPKTHTIVGLGAASQRMETRPGFTSSTYAPAVTATGGGGSYTSQIMSGTGL